MQERAYELERAAQIKYETLPNLEEQLIEAEAALAAQVRAAYRRPNALTFGLSDAEQALSMAVLLLCVIERVCAPVFWEPAKSSRSPTPVWTPTGCMSRAVSVALVPSTTLARFLQSDAAA